MTTYSAHFAPEDEATTLVMLTVSPNAIVTRSGQSWDRNAAVHENIDFTARQRGDTVFVDADVTNVDLPAIHGGEESLRAWREGAVTMTLWCGLRNARAAWPKARFVEYRLIGDARLERYSGVYALEAIDPPVAGAKWDSTSLVPLGR